eukprot:768245-Hanusia_phi.AAC.5
MQSFKRTVLNQSNRLEEKVKSRTGGVEGKGATVGMGHSSASCGIHPCERNATRQNSYAFNVRELRQSPQRNFRPCRQRFDSRRQHASS